MLKSLNQLRKLRHLLVAIKRTWLVKVWGMDIHPTVDMSLSARFDKTNPRGIHVGAYSYVAFDARILSHDMTRNVRPHTRIGTHCFIGGRVLVMPGVEIGDHCLIGAGSVVTKSIPSGSIVAGNPARVIRSGETLLTYGRLQSAAFPPPPEQMAE